MNLRELLMNLETHPSPVVRSSGTGRLMDATGLRAVEAHMLRLASGDNLDPAGEIAREHLMTGGRRIRARLALAAAESLGLDRGPVVGWAAACELLHNATLVHDDIQDGDRTRRDAPTAWSVHGVGQAINVGDLLLMLPFLAIGELRAPPAVRARLSEALARAASRTARGQSTEMDLVHKDCISYDDWAWAAEGKSGALLGLPVTGAALLAGLDDRTAETLGASFSRIGVLYQLQDDLLDLTLHKGHGRRASDLREGKVTSLVALHLQRCPEDAAALLELLRTPSQRASEANIDAAIARFATGGTLYAARHLLEEEERRVLAAPVLSAVPPLHSVATELVGIVRASAQGAIGRRFPHLGDLLNKPYIVVGSGFGGLAAAVRLRAKGHPVLVLEANEQPGGRASVWRRDGFTFDAGPTVITAPHLLDELFTLLGRDPRDYYTLDAVDPFYRVLFHDGSRFDYVGDDERLLAQIEAMSPRDVDGYRALVKQAQAIFDVGYTQLADRPFHEVGAMLRVVPDMLRLGSYRSVYGMVASHIRDERLRQALTFEPLLIGGNPFTAPSIYLLIHWLERKWGVWFPRGGTGAVVAAIVRMLDEVGVEVRCNSVVTRVLVEGGQAVGVELADGQRIDAAGVIYNGDPSFAYSKLLSPSERPSWSDRAVARVKPSMSLFVSYFGTEGTNPRPAPGTAPSPVLPAGNAAGPWPELAHHTIVLGPRYRGLLDDIFEKKVLADDMSLYVHAPTRTDPSLAPSGDDAFYVLSPVPNQRSGIRWEDHQAAYQDKVMAELERRVLPGLQSRVKTQFSVDPRYFEGRLRTVDGAAFGPEPILTQSAWFRYHNASQDVGGLYFVGAGTHPGAGVPGVLNSAKVLDRVVPAAERGLAVVGARSVA